MLDSFVRSRLIESFKSAETRERGRAGGLGKANENRPLLVMAWFVCFHIHGRECDPKVTPWFYSDSRMSLLVLPTNKNTSNLNPPSHHPQQEGTLKETYVALIKLHFCLSEVISIALLHEFNHVSVSPPSCFAYFCSVDAPPFALPPLPSTCVAAG